MAVKKKVATKKGTMAPKKKSTKKATPAKKVSKEKSVVIHYHRYDKDYDNWGVHLWDTGENIIDNTTETQWDAPLAFEEEDKTWKKVTISLKNGYGTFGFLIHKGEEKDPGVDMEFTSNSRKKSVWIVQGIPQVFSLKSEAQAAIKSQQA